MKNIIIEGINGYFETRKNYVYIFLENKNTFLKEEHYAWYEEIEDVTYKKPTNYTYGYIIIYLKSKDSLMNEQTKYHLILDKIDEINLDKNKKLYEILKEIAYKNSSVIIEEITSEEEKDEQLDQNDSIKEKPETVQSDKNKKVDNNITEEIKDNIENKEDQNKRYNDKETNETNNKIKNNDLSKPYIISGIPKKNAVASETDKKNNQVNEGKEVLSNSNVESKDDDKKENYLVINLLEKKLNNLEEKLKVIDIEEKILDKYTDETYEKKEIETLVLEIKKLIDELEKIKKEVSDEEKRLFEKDFLYLDKGNVIITHLNEKIIDLENKRELEDYLETYKQTIKKIEEVDKKVEVLDNRANTKKEEINLADEQYQKDLNTFLNAKSNLDYIKKYREEAFDNLKKVKHEIETTIEPMTRYHYIRTGITNQTRRMAAFMTINSIMPLQSRTLNLALMLSTGLLTIRDLLGYERVEEHYNSVTQTDTLVGLENVDIETSKNMLSSSIEEIDKILSDCEEKYDGYPEFDKLKQEIFDFKEELVREEEEIKKITDKVNELSQEDKVKVLKYDE